MAAEQGMTYIKLLNQAIALYMEERYQEAIDLLNRHGRKVNGNMAQIYNFQYAMTARGGQPNLAMAILQEAVDEGYWYSPDYLRSDDDLEPLRRLDAFDEVVETCARREEEARRNAAPCLKVISEKGGAMVVALHGDQESNAISEPYWRPAADAGSIVALAQSSTESFSDAYVWDDSGKGAAELELHLSSLRERFGVPPERTVLAGFSAGCSVILQAVLDRQADAATLLLVAPWLPQLEEWAPRLEVLKGTKVRIVVGDRDEDCLEGSKRLASLLASLGVDHHLRVIEGMEHDYPDDLRDDIAAVLSGP